MELNAQIETISQEQLDNIFGTKSSTPTADDLIVGRDTVPTLKMNDDPNFPHIDLDKLDELDVTPKTEEKTEAGQDDTGKEGEKSKEEEKVETVKVDDNPEQTQQINSILKNTVEYLIEKGVWQDFEGREELEIDEDTYAELAAKQDEVRIAERFNELVDSTGDYGKAIINHIKSGGNPDEIIDIFKEQKAIEAIDISDEGNQASLVEKYYSEVLGWSKARVDKHINRLKAEDGELEEEAKDIQDKYEDHYKQQLADVAKAQEEAQKEAYERQQKYIRTLTDTIENFEGFTDKEKRMVKDSVLKFNKKLDDGTEVNEFYLKFQELQKDPKEYVELIHYVMDKKAYLDKMSKKSDAKAVDKTWKFVKGNAAVTKKAVELPEHQQSKISKIDFSGLIKK